MIWEKSLRSNLLMISAMSNAVWVTPRRKAFRDMPYHILFLSSAVIRRSHYTTVGQTVCATVAQCEHYVRATVGQTVCPTVCCSVHTMQLLHRQLDKLPHVVFTLCDGLSNSVSRLNNRLIIQHYSTTNCQST